MLDAVGQATRDQPKADLFERLGGSTQLDDNFTALAPFGQHRLYGLHLPSGTPQSLAEVFDDLVR
jgi:hypothetical protein